MKWVPCQVGVSSVCPRGNNEKHGYLDPVPASSADALENGQATVGRGRDNGGVVGGVNGTGTRLERKGRQSCYIVGE